MKNELKVIRLKSNIIVMAELEYLTKTDYNIINPVIVDTVAISGENNALTSTPLLPGTDERMFTLHSSDVLVMADANELYSRFYGSSVFRLAVQREYKNSLLAGKPDLDNYSKIKLDKMRVELHSKFGMMEQKQDDIFDDVNDKVIH